MSKKTYFTLILTALLSLLFGTAALAADQGPDSPQQARAHRRGIGQVTAIGEDSLTLETPRHGEQSLYFDSETRFRTPAGEGSLEDIEVGRWVAVVLPRQDSDRPVARTILLLPEDFDPANRVRAVGEVTSLEEGALHITTLRGDELVLQITDLTRFKGEITALQDLEPGMLVAVLGQAHEDGTVRAAVVYHGKLPLHKLPRFGGLVTAIDPAAGTFSLENRKGDILTFQVKDYTLFRSRSDGFSSMEDIEIGMLLVVRGIPREDQTFLAMAVVQPIPDAQRDGGD